MRIAIGMLVYNGADTLPNTLRSLLDQQILSADGVEATIHVVANGCNDQSVAIAQDVLKTAHDADPDAGWGFTSMILSSQTSALRGSTSSTRQPSATPII